jgi:hypothetical protein
MNMLVVGGICGGGRIDSDVSGGAGSPPVSASGGNVAAVRKSIVDLQPVLRQFVC